jgi:glycosyltransferase involved in cell wall biosynthesis
MVPILQEEPFGLVVLEGKSVGLPAVAFPSGGLVEQIRHGVDGWLCHASSLDGLLEGVRYYLDSPRERDRAAAAGLAVLADPACDLNPSFFAHRWQSLFRSLRRQRKR